MLGAGDCLLIETNKNTFGEIQSHLHVIILEPEENTGNTIIVPVETYRGNKNDDTIKLYSGEHEFITKESYVNYRRAKITSLTYLQQLVDKGIAKQKGTVSQDILKRIASGVLKSQFTPEEIRIMYSHYLNSNFFN